MHIQLELLRLLFLSQNIVLPDIHYLAMANLSSTYVANKPYCINLNCNKLYKQVKKYY